MTTTQFVAISEGNYGCYQRYNCFAQVNTWIRNRAVKKLTRIAQRLLHGRIGAHRILRKIETERTCSQLYTYIHEAVQFEPNLRNDETRSAAERPLSAICVIAQQYSSSTFATLRSLPRCKQILGARLIMLLFHVFFF